MQINEFIADRRSAGRSAVHVHDLETRLGQFSKAFVLPILAISAPLVQQWIYGLKNQKTKQATAVRTKENMLRQIVSLFNFARRQKYVPAELDLELSEISAPMKQHAPIGIYTPDEMRAMLAEADAAIVPALAIAAFAGLRLAEVSRLDWREVRMSEKLIVVGAENAKIAARRSVPIGDNLAVWLAPYSKAFGPVNPCQEELRGNVGHALGLRCERAAARAKVAWKRNGFRHSYVSYTTAPMDSKTKPPTADSDPRAGLETMLLPFRVDPAPYKRVASNAALLLNLAVAIYFLCFLVILIRGSFDEKPGWMSGMGLWTFFGFVVGACILIVLNLRYERLDSAATHAAELSHLCSALTSSQLYVLLLRSFTSRLVREEIEMVETVQVNRPLPRGAGFSQSTYTDSRRTPLFKDDVVATLVNWITTHHTVVINRKDARISAKPVTLVSDEHEDRWVRIFDTLSPGASRIIVVPEASPSLLHEIKQVIREHLPKCIFLMPPTIKDKSWKSGEKKWLSGETRRARWGEILTALKLILPEYCIEGALLTYHDPNSPPILHAYSAESLESLLNAGPDSACPLGERVARLHQEGLLAQTRDKLEEHIQPVREVRLKDKTARR